MGAMKKIYISPSCQTDNIYAVGSTNEAVQCRSIGRLLLKALERNGFSAMTNEEDRPDSLVHRVSQSNGWGADLHLCIHTNACNGQVAGTRILCHDLVGEGYRAARAIMENLAPLTPGSSDNIVTSGFYEIRNSLAPCVYLEVGFHDHPGEAQWIIDHKQEIAEAVCRGLCRHYGAAYVGPEPEELPVYRVQVGAFALRENAEEMLRALQNAGFRGFIRT